MYIDHNRRFVFVSVPKTASTSINVMLNNNYHQKPSLHHSTIEDIINRYPEVSEYYRFGFTRNPWDKFVSCYVNFTQEKSHLKWAWTIKYNYKNFKEFCLDFPNTKWVKWPHFRPCFDFLSINGKLAMDHIGKIEDLEQGVKVLRERGIVGSISPIPLCRTSQHEHYKEYYDKETRKVIGDFYKKDVEAFSYKF